MRLNHIPTGVSAYTNLAISAIPITYSLNSNYISNEIIKGVPDACTNPQVTGGAATHQHSSNGNHTHTATGSSHSHSVGCFGPASNTSVWRYNPATMPITGGHAHGAGSGAVSGTTIGGLTCSTGAHQHANSCNLPQYHELAVIKKTSVSLHNPGVSPGLIGLWTGVNSSVPAGFRIADGNCNTPNLLDRYIRTIPNACTNPGTQGGAATHTHTATTHTHTGSSSHTHTTSGSTAAGGSGGNGSSGGGGSWRPHSHALTSPTPSASASYTTGTGGSHDHGSTTNDPVSLTVSYIQKL